MLLNNKGHQVHVAEKFDSHNHPNMFRNLREVHEPTQNFPKGWATIENRARIKK